MINPGRFKQLMSCGKWLTLALISVSVCAQADEAKGSEESEEITMPFEQLRLFNEVFEHIKQHYVNEVTDEELFDLAIQGMLNGLDPHSAYLQANDYADLKENTEGEFSGLGLEVIMENGFMKVVTPIDDTPAQRSGIQAGDIVLKIDNHTLKGMTLEDSVVLMRGEKGSKVKLTIMRQNEATPKVITLERDIIRIASVKSRLIERVYGYVRISQFQKRTGQEVKIALEGLLEKSNRQMLGLVIDLRNNPGGMLDQAIETADLFLDKGLVVYTQGRNATSRINYPANAEQIIPGLPIVILINQGSASASEIVAGALQDQNRAVIAGTTSFGKGSVQVILDLPRKRGMKLTTSRYYTPSGRSIQAEGIKPDVVLENRRLVTEENQGFGVKEADLSKHLENPGKGGDDEESDSKPGKQPSDAATTVVVLDAPDPVLQDALNLLRVMNLMRRPVGQVVPVKASSP